MSVAGVINNSAVAFIKACGLAADVPLRNCSLTLTWLLYNEKGSGFSRGECPSE